MTGAYVCEARIRPPAGSYGSAGYVYASYYSGPSCTGSLLEAVFYCSNGATGSACSDLSSYQYSEGMLTTLFRALVDAAHNNRKVDAGTGTCNAGGSGCGRWVIFRAQP